VRFQIVKARGVGKLTGYGLTGKPQLFFSKCVNTGLSTMVQNRVVGFTYDDELKGCNGAMFHWEITVLEKEHTCVIQH